jgi:uncharacterized protein YbdZ (MbtH family)
MIGCGNRTILVSEDSPFRVGPHCKSRIYSLTEGQWSLSDNIVEIPEGWYVVPPSFVKTEDTLVKKQ